MVFKVLCFYIYTYIYIQYFVVRLCTPSMPQGFVVTVAATAVGVVVAVVAVVADGGQARSAPKSVILAVLKFQRPAAQKTL